MNKKSNTNFSLRKLLLTALVAGPLATLPAPLWALPSVASTNLSTSSGVSVTQVSSTSISVTAPDKAVLSWTSFGNAAQPFSAGDTINYFQPNSSSSVLNLVTGGFYSNGGTVSATDATTINGTIAANGNVYFLNPNGLVIGSTAQVNVGGFYASTIGETLPGANFGINGTLTFGGATSTTPVLRVQPSSTSTPNIQAVGGGLNIKLYGKGVDVQGGNFYGNLFVNSNGGAATFGSFGNVTVNQLAGGGGNLTVTSGGGEVGLTGATAPGTYGNAGATIVYGSTNTFATAITAANTFSVTPTAANDGRLTASATGTNAIPLTVSGGGGGGQTVLATTDANGAVTGVSIGSGSKYAASSSTVGVTLSTVSGGAAITANTNAQGQVIGFNITSGGSGYTAAPTLTIAAAGSGGVNATATPVLTGGVITSILLGNGNYQSAPTVAADVGGTLTVAGNTSIDTTGSTNGNVNSLGSRLITANTSGTRVTINAGTGTSAGNVNLPSVTLAGLTVNANNASVITTTGSSDISLGASSIAGNLTLNAGGGQIVSSGATSVGGNIDLSQSGNSLTFSGTGNLTFTRLATGSTSTITSSGDILLPGTAGATAAPTFFMPSVSIGGAPTGGTSAVVIPVFTGSSLTSFQIVNNGAGYTAAPNVTVATPGGGSTTVSTTLTAGAVTAVSAPGSTITSVAYAVPTVTASSGTATITPTYNSIGQITGAIVAGAGITNATAASAAYTTAPTFTVTGTGVNAGTSQTLTATIGRNYDSTANTTTVNAVTGVTGVNAAGPTGSRTLSVTSTGGKITGAAVNTASTATLIAAGDISLYGLGTSTAPGSAFSVTSSGGKISIGQIQTNTNGTIRAAGDINVVGFAGGTGFGTNSVGTYLVTGGTATVTSTGGNINLGAYQQSGGAGVLTANNNINVNGVFSGTGAISTLGAVTNTTGSLSLTATTGTITAVGLTSSTTGAALSLTAAGNIVLPSVRANQLSVKSTAGSITQTAATTITQNNAGNGNNKVTLDALNDITVSNTGNDFFNLVLLNGGGGAAGIQVTDANAVILGGGTSTKGNVAITTTSGAISIGASVSDSNGNLVNSTDSLFFGGNLSLTAGGTSTVTNRNNPAAPITGAINTYANSVNVQGAVTLNTTNQNAVLGTTGFGNTSSYSYGSINGNVGTGTLTVTENTTLNLGGITAGTVDVNSLGGNIVNTAGAVVATNLVASAGSIFSPNDVTLSNTGNLINQVNLINANNVNISTGARTGGTTTVTAGSTTQTGKSVLGSLVVTELNGNNLTVNAAGAGSFNNVGFTASGNVTVNAPGSITIQNASNSGSGTVTVTAPGVLSLGSGIALNSTGAASFTATGSAGRIVDASNNVSIYGNATFTSDNDISITKSGHSIGPVSLISGNAGGTPSSTNITYTEAGSANLNVVKVNSGGGTVDGSLTVVSTSGGILQTNTGTAATSGYISVPSINGANTASFTAATGVTLTNPNNTGAALGNNLNVPITLTAKADSSIVQGSGAIATNVRLANVAVTGGGLIVDSSGSATSTISQTSGSSIFSFGTTGLKTGGGAITAANTGNNFGALSLASAGGAVSIAEVGTMNLASVITGGGKFTANSGSGIIQTTNVATFASGAAVAGVNVGGASSLTAGAAGITLNSSNTALGNGGITITTPGAVNVADGALTTTIGTGTNIGGALTIRNTNAGPNASITDGGAGNLTVTGNVLFDLINGNIAISGANNSFGAIGFRANTVAISENTALNLNGGSVASGPVTLSSNGDILTTGVGPLTFAGAATSLTLSSGGNITISNAATFVANGLTFLAKGSVDLSSLSLIGNLNGKTPTNLGAASYKGPTP